MAFFQTLRGLFGKPGGPTREPGAQESGPLIYGVESAATVTSDTAMQVSAVWGAVRIISETIGSLPFDIYEVSKEGRKPAELHPLRRLLTYKPNRYQTSVEFWESMALNLALSGNAYAVIQRTGNRITSLMPLSSSQVETQLLDDGSVVHVYTYGGNVKVYASINVWHIKLFGNGVVGLSPLSYARNSVGIAIAADNRVTKIHSNGAKPAGVLTIDAVLTKDQRTQIKTAFAELEEGNQDRLFVLEAGMQYQQVSMSPKDIELLDSRRFQIEDIGRFFGVPSILLNQTFGQSSLGSNVYEIISGFYKLNLRPYLEKIEESIRCWLLDPSEAERYEAEFNFDSLLRADTLSRYEANGKAITTGQLTPNEARILEGRQSKPGGDQLMIQGATVPILQVLQGGSDGAQNTQP